MAIKVVFQSPTINYSGLLGLVEDGRAADARRGANAKRAARRALKALKCERHHIQSLYVIVFFAEDWHIHVYVKGCCAPMTAEAQRWLDCEVNPPDAEWRTWPV